MLINFLQNKNVDVMLIKETNLTDQDKFKIKNCNILLKRKPQNTRTGGIAILIREGIFYELINTNDNLSEIEHITIRLQDYTYITSNNNWNNKLGKLSYKDNSLWKMNKLLKNNRKPISTLKDDHNIYLNDEEKAKVLGDALEKHMN